MDELNSEQLAASRDEQGTTLVIAGAGTGKTRTLVEKAKNLIRGSLNPQDLLILTFSRKAADEIQERVIREIGPKAKSMASGTFHSFCLSLLKQNSDAFIREFGYRSFPAAIDEAEKERILKDIIRKRIGRFSGLPVAVVYDTVNRLNRLRPVYLKKLEETGLLNELSEVAGLYTREKLHGCIIDFDDMISFASLLIGKNEELRERVRRTIRFILVDEFQDTSESNLKLLRLLLQQHSPNLFAVSDDWQSVYGFRNARIDYTVNFNKYFPGAKVIRLRINYRSSEEIVKLSSRFIRRNRFRTGKRLVSAGGRGGKVFFHSVAGFGEEEALLRTILHDEKNGRRSIAVLYRNNWQGSSIGDALGDDTIAGGVHFMTMHSSKGLEFDTVIVTGISDSIIPDRSSDLEEERRIFYVAMTRARQRLHIIAHLTAGGGLPRFGREIGFRKGQLFKK